MFTVILFRYIYVVVKSPWCSLSFSSDTFLTLLSHPDVHFVKSPCVVKSPWCSLSFCSDTFMLLLSHPVLLLSHPDVHCRSVQTHHPEMTLCGWHNIRIQILSNQVTVQRRIHVKNVHVTYSLPLCLLLEGFHCILVTWLQASFFTCVWLVCSKWHTTYLVVNVKWQVPCRRFSTVILLFMCYTA